MTNPEKVRLADQHRKDRGLNRYPLTIDLTKSTYGDVSSPVYRKKRSEDPSEQEEKLMSCVREPMATLSLIMDGGIVHHDQDSGICELSVPQVKSSLLVIHPARGLLR